MVQDQNIKLWHPARFTHGGMHGSGNGPLRSDAIKPHAVIILNNPLENRDFLLDVCLEGIHRISTSNTYGSWLIHSISSFHYMCRWRSKQTSRSAPSWKSRSHLCPSFNSFLPTFFSDKVFQLPHAICGDMDSLRPDVAEHYRSKGVKIIKDPDQYSTDLTKCLKYIRDQAVENEDKHDSPREKKVDVAILGSLAGRADQAFSQLHHLYTHSQDIHSMLGSLYLITTESVIFLLEKGQNRIHAPVGPKHFTENVGIIPIGRPSVITTHGFEWDVVDWSTEFGSQMSTSNHISAEMVEVETTERVLFTLEIAREDGQ